MSGTDNSPRVLVTRPLPQGERTAERLRALGYTPTLAPMLRIEPVIPTEMPDFNSLQAVMVTSRNGIDRLAAVTAIRSIPIYAVGKRTADAARDHGFGTVESADKDGIALLNLARANLTPESGPVLHVRGRDAAITFEALGETGFDLSELILYESNYITTLPERAITPQPAAALIYSTRTAESFARALSQTPLDPATLSIIGISEHALEPLSQSGARCIPASEPNEEALLAALQQAIKI